MYRFVKLIMMFSLFFILSCDMDYVVRTVDGDDDRSGEDGNTVEITVDERDELERTGHWLKLINMPLNTQTPNVASASVANSVSAVARMDTKTPVKIFKEEATSTHVATSTVYIPLVQSNGTEFTATGVFYVMFTVRVDAITEFVVVRSDNILVPFTDGRGTLDVEFTMDNINAEKKIKAIIAAGGYIRFFNLPRNISNTKISFVSVSTGNADVAYCADYEAIAIRGLPLSSEAFVPLTDTRFLAPFSETGNYFTSFAIEVDALSRIVTDPDDPPLLYYKDGVLEFDVSQLPPSPALPPQEPHALTIIGLPDTANITNLADVFIWNQAGKVAKCADYTNISIFPFAGKKAAIIPLVYDNSPQFNGEDFDDSGLFLVTFSFFPDVLQSLVVTAANNCIAVFTNGSATVDIDAIPVIPHNYLTITNLPPQLPVSGGVSNVFVHNQAGRVAKCEDYNWISFSSTATSTTVRIPLVYTSNSTIFTNTGSYVVSFDINADALSRITITEKDAVAVSFSAGNGTLDANTLPKPSYLTITNLPPQLPASGIADVFVWNQAGKVAQCDNYEAIILAKYQNSSTVYIPITYLESQDKFADTGDYFVSFEINADVLNRITITEKNAVIVRFTAGNGTLDANTLPSTPCLTLTGLPAFTANTHFVDVSVYGPAGIVAQFSGVNDITVTLNGESAIARIPLVSVRTNDWFRETGSFYVTLDIPIDLDNYILIDENNPIRLQFQDGFATHNMLQSLGWFAGELTNPSDTAAPMVKAGTAFEINGTFFRLEEDAPVMTTVAFATSTLVYIYAVQRYAGVDFEFSTTAPEFNPARNAFYLGDKRCLWKMFLFKSSTEEFFAKTFIGDPFPHLSYYTVNAAWIPPVTSLHSLDGAGNPAPTTVTLQEGVYLFKLIGAGGGRGQPVTSILPFTFSTRTGGAGGQGGAVADIVFVDSPTEFALFTGGGGEAGGPIQLVLSGPFSVPNAGGVELGVPSSPGGGGGGSGSFIFANGGYFLSAGGGGGGSSGSGTSISYSGAGQDAALSSVTLSGGAGGAGGSIGPGGAGGAGGAGLARSSSAGGAGGGASLSLPGGMSATSNGFNGTSTSTGASGGTAAYCELGSTSGWKNTNGANGQGANAVTNNNGEAGGPGGNNRNDDRGGGASPGSAGSLMIYQLGSF